MNEQILTGLAAAQTAVSGAPGEKPQADNFGLLGNVTVEVAAELGRVELPLRDVAALHAGQVLELDKAPDSPFAVVVNGVAIATAEAVVVDGHVGLKIIDLIG